MSDVICVWEAAAILGEGPLWVARENAVYWVDIGSKHVHRYSLGDGTRRTWTFATEVTSLVERQQGGFIGTVRGIGEALAQADKAVQGDIAGVTQSLGVAFNSTFIALLISIFLMFLVHQLQLMQERLVYDSEAYCDDKVIRHMKAD